MAALSSYDLLKVWDAGYSHSSVDRALILLAAAYPEAASKALAELSIGERNSRLMRLRAITFGSQIQAISNCPNCGEPVELDVWHDQLSVAHQDAGPLFVHLDGHHVDFRPPNSGDLAAVRGALDLAAARRILVDRCSSSALAADQMPEDLIDAISAAMERADPQSEVRLALQCPACSGHWEELFDIASFLWTELHAWALRALREVHQLASAYGWSETDILAMSSWRRQIYLEMTAG